MKKICFLINSLSSRSGAERVACLLANYFVDVLNYEVFFINRDTNKKDIPYFLNKKIQIFYFEGNIVDFYKKTKSTISIENPDYILVHNMGKLTIFSLMLNIKFGIKLISLEHGAFVSRSSLIKMISKVLYKKLYHVVVLTDADKKIIEKYNKKVSKIYNPSPFETFLDRTYSESCKNIVALGRLHPEKNFEHLILAWKMLGDVTTEWSLKIYGKGEEYFKLESLIKEYDLQNVFLMGESKDVEKIYKESAIYIMTSKNEGLPMVLIEAQSFGVPIISYDCPHGPAEIISNGVDGILVNNQDYRDLSEKILNLILNFELRKRMSKNALESSQRFSGLHIINEWKKIFNE